MQLVLRSLRITVICLIGVGPQWVADRANAQDITLGVIAGMSGSGASYGAGISQGAEMAVREINAAGGVNGRQIKLLIVDDASSPARSAIAMRRLVATNAVLIVGGWGSAQVLANMDIVEQAGVPYIVVGATHPQITNARNKWTFRVIQTDAVITEELARIVVAKLGAKRVAVINDTNDYGTGNRDVFVAALARLGVKPVEMQSYQTADKDFGAQLARIASANPEALAIFGTVPAAPAIMRQARALGIKARFVGSGGLANETLITSAPTASDGTILMSYFSEDADAEAQAWADRYRMEFAGRADAAGPALGAWEYRAIMGIVRPCLASVDSAGFDRMRLRDCIANWRGKLFGISSELYFDKTGQLVQQPVAVEVSGGVFRFLKTIQ